MIQYSGAANVSAATAASALRRQGSQPVTLLSRCAPDVTAVPAAGYEPSGADKAAEPCAPGTAKAGPGSFM